MSEKDIPSVNDVVDQIGNYMPNLLAGLIVFVLGLVVAWLGAKLVVRLLILSRIDRVMVRLGWGQAVDKGDVRHSLFAFLGTLTGGVIFLIFLDNATVIWRLTVLSEMLERFVVLIPRLVASSIIILVGWGIAAAASKSVRRSLYQEQFERARLVGRIVFSSIIVVTSAIALVQLDIAVGIVTGAFFIAFGTIALSVVLAFGLGSKSAVELMWKKKLRDLNAEPEEESSDEEPEE